MKNYLFFLITFVSVAVSAQKTGKLTGTWEAKLNVGVTLRLVFKFVKDSTGNIKGTAYSPDQGNQSMPCSEIFNNNDSLSFKIAGVNANYAGSFQNDSVITGKFTQGRSFDLTISKVLKVTGLIRPQTPRPPFPYISEDVEYDNAGKTFHYGATITIPKLNGPFAAILLITGSGQQNRDEEIFEHKPFAVIADYLTRQGYIIMRVDDRGVGKSSGDFSKATTADFAKDVNTSLDFLKRRKDVDTTKLGMLGHSEGGLLAPMVAAKRNDIDFIILLAGPGEKIPALMKQQNTDILKSMGFTNEAVIDYGNLYEKLIGIIVQSNNKEQSEKKLNEAVKEWIKNTPKDIVTGTTGITNDSAQTKFVATINGELSSPWYKYFLQLDPAEYLKKLHCKVLALNGSKDLQVAARPNLNGITNALKESKSPSYEVKEIPGLNHLFQDCKTCTVNEYGLLEETFSPKALNIISEWLKKIIN